MMSPSQRLNLGARHPKFSTFFRKRTKGSLLLWTAATPWPLSSPRWRRCVPTIRGICTIGRSMAATILLLINRVIYNSSFIFSTYAGGSPMHLFFLDQRYYLSDIKNAFLLTVCSRQPHGTMRISQRPCWHTIHRLSSFLTVVTIVMDVEVGGRF